MKKIYLQTIENGYKIYKGFYEHRYFLKNANVIIKLDDDSEIKVGTLNNNILKLNDNIINDDSIVEEINILKKSYK